MWYIKLKNILEKYKIVNTIIDAMCVCVWCTV